MWTLISECIILVGKTCKRHISKTELHIATGLHWENEAANLATCLLNQMTLLSEDVFHKYIILSRKIKFSEG